MAEPRDDLSALVLRVPEAEPLVGPWRVRFDANAAAGVPAHVTVLFPWVPPSRQTPDDHDALRSLAAATSAPALSFAAFGDFPSVLYLAPEPASVVADLTRAVVARWPEWPAYGGQFGDEPVPHLTVADGFASSWAQVRDAVEPQLPVVSVVGSLTLLRVADGRASVDAEFPFAVR